MASSLAALYPSTLTHQSFKLSELQAIRISLALCQVRLLFDSWCHSIDFTVRLLLRPGSFERHQIAGLTAELYRNEMNRLAQIAVLVCVAFPLSVAPSPCLRVPIPPL